jgi:hypothetical protein
MLVGVGVASFLEQFPNLQQKHQHKCLYLVGHFELNQLQLIGQTETLYAETINYFQKSPLSCLSPR